MSDAETMRREPTLVAGLERIIHAGTTARLGEPALSLEATLAMALLPLALAADQRLEAAEGMKQDRSWYETKVNTLESEAARLTQEQNEAIVDRDINASDALAYQARCDRQVQGNLALRAKNERLRAALAHDREVCGYEEGLCWKCRALTEEEPHPPLTTSAVTRVRITACGSCLSPVTDTAAMCRVCGAALTDQEERG